MTEEQIRRYFERIGLEMPETVRADGELLSHLVDAHVRTIPVENVEFLRGRISSLETESLYRKIVERGEGGVCLDLNGLFGALLRALGYTVRDVRAEMYRFGESVTELRHRALLVTDCDGNRWWADVGDAYSTLRQPLPLVTDEMFENNGGEFIFSREGELYRLDYIVEGCCENSYVFADEPVEPEIFEAFKRAAAQEDSVFRRVPIFAIKLENGLLQLFGDKLISTIDGMKDVRRVGQDALPLLYPAFGIAYKENE